MGDFELQKVLIWTVLLAWVLFGLIACGSGSLSAAGMELRYFWPLVGRNSYEAVVYPAAHAQPIGIVIKKSIPTREKP